MIAYDVPWAKDYYGLQKGYYYIWRFMIDKRCKGNGGGKGAEACPGFYKDFSEREIRILPAVV